MGRRSLKTRGHLLQYITSFASDKLGNSNVLHGDALQRIIANIVYGTSLKAECTLRRVLTLSDQDRTLWMVSVLSAALTENGLHDDAEAIEEYLTQKQTMTNHRVSVPNWSNTSSTCLPSSPTLLPHLFELLSKAPVANKNKPTQLMTSPLQDLSLVSPLRVTNALLESNACFLDGQSSMDYCKNPTAVSSCLEREYSIPSAVQLSSPTFRPSIPVDSEPQTLLLSNEDGRLDPTSKPVESAIESLDMYGRDTCHDFYATLHGTSPRLSMSLHQHCLTQPKAQPSLHHQSMLGLENSNSTSALQPSIGLLTPFSQASELNRHVPATPFVTNSTRVDSYKQLYPGTSFTSSVCAAMSHLCACGAVMTLIQNRKVFCPSGHNSRLPPQAQEALDSSVLCTPTISGFIKTESRNCATLVSAPIMIHQSNSSIRHHDANPNSRTNRISNCTSSASPSASYANTLSKISTTTSIATDHLAQLGLSKRRVFGLLRHEMAIHSSARARMVL